MLGKCRFQMNIRKKFLTVKCSLIMEHKMVDYIFLLNVLKAETEQTIIPSLINSDISSTKSEDK